MIRGHWLNQIYLNSVIYLRFPKGEKKLLELMFIWKDFIFAIYIYDVN